MSELPAKLPVAKILLAALVAPGVHARTILWFAIPVIAVRVVGSLVEPASAALFGWALVNFGLTLILAVVCHRIVVLGTQSVAGFPIVWWTWRETRFLGWSLGIGLIAGLVMLPALSVSQSPWLLIPLLLPGLYVFSRLALVLPIVATDGVAGLGKAWDLSRGNGLRLVAVVTLLPFSLEVVVAWLPRPDVLVLDLLLIFAELYVFVVGVAALSMAYRELDRARMGPLESAGVATP